MLAQRHGVSRDDRVGMVGRGDHHGIDLLARLVGVAEREQLNDFRLAHLRAGGQADLHRIERPIQREEDLRLREARLRRKMNAGQEGIHLVEIGRTLIDLEHGLEIIDRTASLNIERTTCQRMPRRTAEVHLSREEQIVEIRAIGVYFPAHVDLHVQQDMGQTAFRVGNRRHGNLAIVEIHLPAELRHPEPPDLSLREVQITREGPAEEVALDIELICLQIELIIAQLQASERCVTGSLYQTVAHFSRDIF